MRRSSLSKQQRSIAIAVAALCSYHRMTGISAIFAGSLRSVVVQGKPLTVYVVADVRCIEKFKMCPNWHHARAFPDWVHLRMARRNVSHLDVKYT